MSSPPNALANCVVAIPAKNEAARIAACLRALDQQVGLQDGPAARASFKVVVFANDCIDETALIARRMGEKARYELRVVEARLPKSLAHAGGARRTALDLAEAWLDERSGWNGVLLTTDADSRVAPNWLSANLHAFEEGADAALGRISLDEEATPLPPALHARGKLEAVYEEQLTELTARLDPQEANPWPHHATISGASLAVSREAYLDAGRMPPVPLGEDKAFVAALRRRDARIRFAPDIEVVTSGRTGGRAPGGVADTLRFRSADPGAPCDEALERSSTAFRRALWRGRLRRDGLAGTRWREGLQVSAETVRRAKSASTFGAAWEIIEAESPRLQRLALTPSQLPRHIAISAGALRRLQAGLAASEDVDPIFALPVSADDL